MNFKKIIATTIALCIASTQAFAATIENPAATMSQDGTSAQITATINQGTQKADKVLIKVLMPGYTDDEVTAGNIFTSVLAIEEQEIPQNNTISASIGFNTTRVQDGRYYVYFSGKNIVEPQDPTELWYITDTKADEIISYIKNTAVSYTDVQTKLFENLAGVDYNNANMLGATGSLYTSVAQSVATLDAQISKVLFNDKNELSNKESLQEMMKTATLMAALDANQAATAQAADKKLLEDIFTSGDAENAEVLYTNNLTETGKQKTLAALSQKGFADAAVPSRTQEFKKAFVKQTVYDAIYNYMQDGQAVSGSAHIDDCLTIGQNVYTNATAFLADTVNLASNTASIWTNAASLTTPELLDSYMHTLLNPTPPPDDDMQGGDHYGITGVQGGSYTEILKEESEKREEAALGGFADISNHAWAKSAIEYLSDKNIIVGTSQTTFEPDRSIKRGEFAKILVLALNLELSDKGSEFKDVMDSAWYTPYIMALKENGLAEGSGDGYFNPESSITREDACTLIYRALSDKLSNKANMTFTDGSSISEYAQDAIAALVDAKIITGNEDGTFKPQNTTTRAEAAVIFYRLLTEGGLA